MGKVIFYISLCQILPIALLCFYLEKRARRIMISVLLGVIACLSAYFVNSLLNELINFENINYATFIAPIVEESLKLGAALIIVLAYKKGLRGSVANAFSIGVGFCMVENFFYLFECFDTANVVWVILRCVGTGLMHSMSAVILGLGIYYGKNSSKGNALHFILSIIAAMFYHGLYNFLVGNSNLVPVGVCLPIVSFIIILVLIRTGKIKTVYGPEIDELRKESENNEEIKEI